MTDPISKFYINPALDKTGMERMKRNAADKAADSGIPPAKIAPFLLKDEVVLSNISQRAMQEPAFDRAKVEVIKQAIKEGNYPMNSRTIAESFFAVEKLIGD